MRTRTKTYYALQTYSGNFSQFSHRRCPCGKPVAECDREIELVERFDTLNMEPLRLFGDVDEFSAASSEIEIQNIISFKGTERKKTKTFCFYDLTSLLRLVPNF